MAGLGEVSTHVAAVLFFVSTEERDYDSVVFPYYCNQS